ncbi:MAG: HAMP domain-containing histidine kinase [Jatrophihabitans sp.]|nr:MAG: HAMP domain-containing histidine kinase [Jatrophihabitans sp.]
MKLVAAVAVLLVVALAGSGAAAAATLHGYLVRQIDAQLLSAAQSLAHGPRPGPPSPEDRGRGRLPSAYVVETLDAGGRITSGPTSNLPDPHQALPALPVLTAAQIAAGPRHLTVDSVRGDRQWRVLAAPIAFPDGSVGTVLVAQSLQGVHDTVSRLILLLIIIGGAAVVVITGAGWVLVRASLRPLRAVERAAATIAAGDLSHRVPVADSRTEVGRVSAALNTMLARIERAFEDRAASEQAARASEERMRRFVADASHELRTPLTTIRGFAELFRQGAPSGAVDAAHVMARIEAEATRMGLLVEDLLLLARLDQERPLAQAPVDLLAVAGDAVQSVRITAPGHPVTLTVGSTDPPPIVLGDEPRLRQVLGNLLANAVRHTPDGTPVSVTVGTRVSPSGPALVVLEVADEGPGLTPEAAARVFERFYRADQVRGRRDGGTGLGLAIVAGLVAAHRGRVTVQTSPGHGARFRVELPLAES